MSQGERGILEFSYKYPGKYMFHAHKTEFAEKGWTGLFLVNDNSSESVNQNLNVTSALNNTSYSNSNFSNATNIVTTGGFK
jgi:hypothetical protein